MINAEGGQPRQVTFGDLDNAVPSWSVDGQWLYCASNQSGSWEVWKRAVDGGASAQVTHHGGFAPLPSPDGRWVYYAKGRDLPGLWRVPVDGGEEIKILDAPPAAGWGYYAIARDGIYFADVLIPDQGGVYFYDLRTQKRSLVHLLTDKRPESGAPALAISPDERTFLISLQEQPLVSIILVENFRH